MDIDTYNRLPHAKTMVSHSTEMVQLKDYVSKSHFTFKSVSMFANNYFSSDLQLQALRARLSSCSTIATNHKEGILDFLGDGLPANQSITSGIELVFHHLSLCPKEVR